MPSPSAFSKFSSSILKFFKHAQFFVYTQNHLGIRSYVKTFWIYFKDLNLLKNQVYSKKSLGQQIDLSLLTNLEISWKSRG